jgi:hypothetical protein
VVSVKIIKSNYSYRIKKLKQDERISSDGKAFELLSEASYNDFPAIDAAAFNSVRVTLSDGQQIDFRELDSLQTAIKRLKYAETVSDKESASEQLAFVIADQWKVKFFEKDLDCLKERIPEIEDSSIDLIKKKTLGREIASRLCHSHTKFASFSAKYISIYNSILTCGQKVIVFNGSMASGKTVAMRKLYDEAREAGHHPIFITSKRSIAANFYSEAHDDHYKSEGHDNRKGVVGVINSIVGERYEEDRKKCKVVFIDESEDLMDHVAFGTLGQIAADRLEALRVLADLMTSADKMVVADAMITDRTLNMLSDLSGGEVKIIKAGETQNVTLALGTKSEVIGLAKARMLAGKRVVIFQDYNAREFSQTAEALAAGTDKKVIKLNAEYFEKTGKKLRDLEEILKSADAAVISPVVNAGTSITDAEHDEVFVLAGRTLTPTAILQSARRCRAAKTVYIAFRGGRSSARPTTPISVMSSIVVNSEDPVGVAQKLLEDKFGRYIAEHIASKNMQFKHFEQTLLISAEQMGFDVQRPWVDKAINEQGKEAVKAGRKKNEEKQHYTAFETAEKFAKNQGDDIGIGTSEERSFEQDVAARTISAMNTMSLSNLNEQTYNEIFKVKIDSVVSMRQKLSKADTLPERMEIAANCVVELLSDAGVNLDDISKSYVTAESAELAYEKLIEHVAINEEASITGLELVKYFFADTGVNVTSSMRGLVIKNILNSMGYTLKAEKKGRSRFYKVAPLVKKVNINGERIDCNIKELADKYIVLTLTKKPAIYSMKGVTPYGVYTESEKKLAKAIEVRKNEAQMEEIEAERDYSKRPREAIF